MLIIEDRPADLTETTSRERRRELSHELLTEASHTEDPHRRAELLNDVVLLNRCVADAIAQRYRGRGIPVEDLCQAAYEGLVKAVQRFDPEVRPDLLTYAVPTIRGEVQRWFRDHGWMVRPPRRIQELQWSINRSTAQLWQDLGREPTDAEVAADLGCTVDDVREAEQAQGSFTPASLDRPLIDQDGPTLGDTLTDEEDVLDLSEARTVLAPLVRQLSERDRRILYLRFYEDQTQSEIGQQLGITQMQVSRLLTRIYRDLRQDLDATA